MKLFYLFCLAFLVSSCGNNEKNVTTNNAVEDTLPVAELGANLFKVNCSQCHMAQKDFIGPALAGVESRWKSKKLLYAFIKNSEEVIKRDAYAKELFEKWKQSPMLPFPNLTDADIDAILAYANGIPGR